MWTETRNRTEQSFLTSFHDIQLKRNTQGYGVCLVVFWFSILTSPLGRFSIERETKAAWNRDDWKENINFRSQNLPVCCRLKLSFSEKPAVLSYFFCTEDFVHVCGRESKSRVDDLIADFQVWRQ